VVLFDHEAAGSLIRLFPVTDPFSHKHRASQFTTLAEIDRESFNKSASAARHALGGTDCAGKSIARNKPA
jgi:hypothetical protein